MTFRSTLGLCGLALALAACAVPVQGSKDAPRDEHAAGPDMARLMEAMMAAGTPGAVHAELARSVGTWKAHVKHWMDPTQPPSESTGTSRYEMSLDGRYLVEHHAGEMPGMGPFTGMGILAFNNATRQYDHVWMDSMSTGLFISHGSPAEDGSIVFHGEMDNPLDGSKWPCRMVSRMVDPDHRVFEMYCSMGGPETKSMEIHYTRGATP